MATLVLSVAGQIVGGPVGSMIGATVGQYIDQNILFKPKAQHGPRLSELAVQASSYGAQIPRIYGRMRVAGQVIWALPLKETRHKQSAKGRPDQISYTYSASFAVALSSRALVGVKRIWADGTLIRKANGQWLRDAVMRFHAGGADQPADALIASAEGMNKAPAHRGLAYVVFEDLPLADYGNRIPSLTFEVEADDGIDAAGVAGDMLLTLAVPSEALWLEGYAASGDSVRTAIGPLTDATGWALGGDGLVMDGPEMTLQADAIQSADEIPAIEMKRGGADAVPSAVDLRHYDPARDYQIGMQRARLVGGPQSGAQGGREMQADIPAALSAPAALALAERLAARAGEGVHRLIVPVGPQALMIKPGTLLRVTDVPGVWRVQRWQWEGDAASLELVRHAQGYPSQVAAEPGRSLPSPEGASGALFMMLVDLPAWGTGAASAVPLVGLFVASEQGRGRVALSITTGEGTEPLSLGQVIEADAMGHAQNVLGAGSAALFDNVNSVEVTLVNADMALANANDAALLAGANAAILGDELIQFGRAEVVGAVEGGGMRYRLSHLLRGRGGTEDAMTNHAVGENFVLLPDDPAQIMLLPAQIGLLPLAAGMKVDARRLGSDEHVVGAVTSASRALKPLAPVHLRARREADGSLACGWTRRSRDGWRWMDGVDAPLGEASERYRVRFTPIGGGSSIAESQVEVVAPQCIVSAQDLGDWRSSGANAVRIAVAQIGTHAVSAETGLIVALYS